MFISNFSRQDITSVVETASLNDPESKHSSLLRILRVSFHGRVFHVLETDVSLRYTNVTKGHNKNDESN